MKTVLFSIRLKPSCLEQYQNFAKQTVENPKAYKDMLNRYDIHCAKIWHQHINSADYIFVYHEAGSDFEKKMQDWDTSTHPYDTWFRENMLAVYDIKNAADMQQPTQLVDFIA